MHGLRTKAWIVLAVCAIAATLQAPARADGASRWAQDSHSAMRLIAGTSKKDAAHLRAGIELKLDPGWKTYWRYPGDSGVPPQFDFSRSQNLAAVKVLYPAPRLFTDEYGNTLGYENGVIFPLQVTPRRTGEPVKLTVKLAYAVCKKLCVPVQGQAEITLAGGKSADDPTLETAETRVPKPMPATALGLTARRLNDGPKPVVAVDLKAPTDAPVQVFVEGPTPEWALPIPLPAKGAPAGHRRFDFALDGLPPGVSPKGPFELTFTVVEGPHAYEVKTRLD